MRKQAATEVALLQSDLRSALERATVAEAQLISAQEQKAMADELLAATRQQQTVLRSQLQELGARVLESGDLRVRLLRVLACVLTAVCCQKKDELRIRELQVAVDSGELLRKKVFIAHHMYCGLALMGYVSFP